MSRPTNFLWLLIVSATLPMVMTSPVAARTIVRKQDLTCPSQGVAPVYVLYINGTRTTFSNLERTSLPLMEGFFRESNIPIAGLMASHNPTGWTGGIGDIYEGIRQMLSRRTPDKNVVNPAVDWILEVDRNLRERCPGSKQAKFMLVGHSQGSLFMEDVGEKIQSLNQPSLTARTSILALSPFTKYKRVNIRRQYVLRKDDLPKARKLAKIFSPSGNFPANLPGLVLLPKLKPDKSSNVEQISHRLDYYIGSASNHSPGWKPQHRYSVDLARTKAADYVRQLLAYDPGFY